MSSITDAIPPLPDFFPPTPGAYAFLLNIFQFFPLFTIIQWLTQWQPQGKTSLASSRFNVSGRMGWCIMELAGPINLIFILSTLPGKLDLVSLPPWNKLVAGLYLLHYANRAVVTPLFLAPSMSPMHPIITVFAMIFNFVNSSCLGGWLVGMYGVPVAGYQTDGYSPSPHPQSQIWIATKPYIPWLGLALFGIGMYGNIAAETTFFRLRREEADRREQENKDKPAPNKNGNKYSKVYIIPPPTGLFKSILFPHYVLEWVEWTGLIILSTAVFSPTPASTITNLLTSPAPTDTPPIILAPWYVPLAKLMERLELPLPLPAVVLCVNVIATTLPRARWGRKWYVERFGEGKVAGRGAAVPFCKYM